MMVLCVCAQIVLFHTLFINNRNYQYLFQILYMYLCMDALAYKKLLILNKIV